MLKRLGRLIALIVLATLVPLQVNAVARTAAADPRVPGHSALLGKAQSGRAALRAMDAATEAVAARRNHLSATRLRTVVEHDSTIWLARDGKIFFRDTANAADVATVAQATAGSAPTWATYPTADSLTLHSKPGSKHTIYLDFDGYTLGAGQAWPSNGIPAATYGGFTLDGNAGAFSTDELDYIQTVWRIVAEKYSPFDVDVTTQAPATSDAVNRSTDQDDTWGSQVVITNDMTARGTACTANASSGCVGIAFVDSFNTVEPAPQYTNYFEPAWVYTKFTSGSAVFTAGQVANTAAHEIGHTLGLYHDRTSGTSYYPGHDNWFPIMGASLTLAIGQFNDGGYPGAVTDQVDPISGDPNPDDLDVIAKVGAPVRADDVPGTTALGSAASYTVDGIIERTDDVDTYTVDRTCSGSMTVSAEGIGMGQTLDIGLGIQGPGFPSTTVTPDSGADTGTAPNTPTGVDASSTIQADAGTWTITVTGTGDATNAYPSYGSLGQYHLTITGCSDVTGTAPGQPATVTAVGNSHATTGTISWAAPVDDGGSVVTGYTVTAPDGPHSVGAGTFSYPVTGLTPGTTYDVSVAAVNAHGPGTAKHANLRVATWAPPTGPNLTVTTSLTKATITWTAPANPGHAVPAGWHLILRDKNLNTISTYSTVSPTIKGVYYTLSAGSYSVVVYQRVTSDDGSASSSTTKSFTVITAPSAPKIGTPSSGASGGSVTALARWGAPTSTGGSAITGYKVIAYKCTSSGTVVSHTTSKLLGASVRSYSFPLAAGYYKFRVIAYNKVGHSAYSAYSSPLVRAR